MTVPFAIAASSRPLPEPVVTPPTEYQEKYREMKAALESFRALFGGVDYEILCGVPTEGENARYALVEGRVFLEWHDDVPKRFNLRTYLESDSERLSMVDAMGKAIEQVFAHCFQRAEHPHNQHRDRFIAFVAETQHLMEFFRRGFHIEMYLTPRIEGNRIDMMQTTMCWIYGHSHECHTVFEDDYMLEAQQEMIRFIIGSLKELIIAEAANRGWANEEAPERPIERLPTDEAPAPREPAEPVAVANPDGEQSGTS